MTLQEVVAGEVTGGGAVTLSAGRRVVVLGTALDVAPFEEHPARDATATTAIPIAIARIV